jgi:hypothetical protein
MRFKLSNETLRSIEQKTGRTYSSLTSQPMRCMDRDADVAWKSEQSNRSGRIIPPRGSVYLQMGRVTPLDVVKKFIFNFK